MKKAFITGTTSGIGLEVTKKLLEKNFTVIGISSSKNKIIDSKNYFHHQIDLANSINAIQEIESLAKEIKNLDVLILNSGKGMIGYHEELNSKKLVEMMNLNFITPILITKLFLRKIKESKGTIFIISSITAKNSSPLASAYSATKAGISRFGNSIFEEIRRYGAKVVNIHPDIVKTNFYKDSSIEEYPDRNSYILPEEIANMIGFILEQSEIIIQDVTIYPQMKRIKRKSSKSE
jgi:hypothetical protein